MYHLYLALAWLGLFMRSVFYITWIVVGSSDTALANSVSVYSPNGFS